MADTPLEPRAKGGTAAYWLTNVYGHGLTTLELNVLLMTYENKLRRESDDLADVLHEPLDNLSAEMKRLLVEGWENYARRHRGRSSPEEREKPD